MFKSLWRRFNAWQSVGTSSSSRRGRNRAMLCLETLEDRVTPTNIGAAISTATTTGITTLTLTKSSGDIGLTIAPSGAFQGFMITPAANDSVNNNNNGGTFDTGSLTTLPITAIVVKLGSGTDSLSFDGTTSNGIINLSAGLTITGGSGDKTITAQQLYTHSNAGILSISLTGSGNEIATFTDCDIAAAATVKHTSSGNTQFTINTSGNNPYALNRWKSLTITNGKGSDLNTIQDTDFAASVSITNGSGSGSGTNFAGSKNIFSASNNLGLLTVTGGVAISTSSGQSDTEIFDYNVQGATSITTGSGASNQTAANFVGIENSQTTSGTGLPVFGSISIIGTAVKGLPLGLQVFFGTNISGNDYPVVVTNGISISAAGTGSGSVAAITMNDLTVTGTTSITLASSTGADTVSIFGDAYTSTYGPLSITSAAASPTFNLQTQKGTLAFAGAANFKFTAGLPQIFLGSSAGPGLVQTSGSFGVSATGGSQNIVVQNSILGSINFAITGNGNETSSFTDVNVTGAATVSHTGTGDTQFQILTSNKNQNSPPLNTWNSLSITNGTGRDTNTITDTDFAGNVTINNGAGHASDGTPGGGSTNVFHAVNYNTSLLTIHGNLSISTKSGQSKSEIYDYNVNGTTGVTTGAGISGQSTANYVGIEDNQTNGLVGVPKFGGGMTITGTTVNGLAPGLIVFLGTNAAAKNFPLVLDASLTVSAGGTGSAVVTFNDVYAPNGTTAVTFGSSTSNNTLNVQGSTVTSEFNNFNVTSTATGANFYNFQNQAGALSIDGLVNVKLGNGDDTVNLAANAGKIGGVNNALLNFWAVPSGSTPAEQFDGGSGTNQIYGRNGALNITVFFVTLPTIKPNFIVF